VVRQEENNSKLEEKERGIRRKMAEELAKRLKTSPEEIEEGVKEFIEKSSEALGRAEAKPPYRRSIWYEKFFDLIHQRTIEKISLEFIYLNIVSAKSEAYKFRNGLRFLGLIDEKGHPTPKLEKLRVTGEDFKKNLAKVIKEAYSDLLNTIVVEKAEPESLINYMIRKYGYSRPLAEEATMLFAYFCNKAAIPISTKISSFRITRERRRVVVKRRSPKTTTEKEVEYDESFATLKFDEFSFAVKKELSAIEFARKQVNLLLDYLKNKLIEEKSTEE